MQRSYSYADQRQAGGWIAAAIHAGLSRSARIATAHAGTIQTAIIRRAVQSVIAGISRQRNVGASSIQVQHSHLAGTGRRAGLQHTSPIHTVLIGSAGIPTHSAVVPIGGQVRTVAVALIQASDGTVTAQELHNLVNLTLQIINRRRVVITASLQFANRGIDIGNLGCQRGNRCILNCLALLQIGHPLLQVGTTILIVSKWQIGQELAQ